MMDLLIFLVQFTQWSSHNLRKKNVKCGTIDVMRIFCKGGIEVK